MLKEALNKVSGKEAVTLYAVVGTADAAGLIAKGVFDAGDLKTTVAGLGVGAAVEGTRRVVNRVRTTSNGGNNNA